MDTEIEAAGEPSSSRGHGKRSRASSSSTVPSDAFEIILERIDGLRDVQNEQSDRLVALQDQMNILLAKFDILHPTVTLWPFRSKRGRFLGQLLRGSASLNGSLQKNYIQTFGVAFEGECQFEGEPALNLHLVVFTNLHLAVFTLVFTLCLCCWCWYYALDNVVFIMGLLHFGQQFGLNSWIFLFILFYFIFNF